MKIYFAGSITGGRQNVDNYKIIVDFLSKYGDVLTKHVADKSLSSTGEDLTPSEVYQRDINWLREADILVAEVSTPSLGVGYEIGYAEKLNKKIICAYEKNKNISFMIKGNNNIKIVQYNTIKELLEKLEKELIK